MIKNLVFDFGKVLVDYNFQKTIDTFFDDPLEAEKFGSIFTSNEFLDRCDKEDIPFDDIIKDMQKQYPQYAEQAQMFGNHYVDYVLGEVFGMREILIEMRNRGFKLYGLTNWCSKVHDVMKAYDIFELLDGRVISSEEHLIKPDVAIYQRLCEKYDLRPEECVFADDKVVNVVGAISAGMKAIIFQNAKQYKRELEDILVQESKK